ncbi:MAG: hypothetical protein JWM33_3989 [Caulobacteraceae bacterium]|nr:hypothetical protein [Caulobacteraceae bacterium]
MRSLFIVVGLAALSSLAACATGPVASDGSAYGYYLAGKAATSSGDSQAAGRYFTAAKAAGAEAGDLNQQIFLAALDLGDIAAAARVAPPKVSAAAGDDADGGDSADSGGSIYEIGVLTRLTALMAAGDGKGALALEKAEPLHLLQSATDQLEPWLQLMAGQTPDDLDQPAESGRTISVANLVSQSRLDMAVGKPDQAEADFKTLEAGGLGAATVIEHGAMLERAGRGAEAKTLYSGILKISPDRADVKAALDRVNAGGKPPPAPTAAVGASLVLLSQAQQMSRIGVPALQIAFLRMGLTLDPTNYSAWIDLGDVLADGSDFEGALAAYQKTPATSLDAAAAQVRIASLYQDHGDSDKALAAGAKALATWPADRSVGGVYAQILARNGRYPEAIKIYDRLIDQASTPDWRLYYQRWNVRAQAGNDAAGEGDLQAALKLAPNEATLLNALGYSWIDRSENLDQAMGMVRRAAAAQPNNGEIIDSLGWGYFKQGDYASAVTQLENAVQLEPAEAEINDHLGDAYWRAGRQTEARFQWERALTLDPDAVLKAKVQAKLQNGLPAAAAPLARAGA